MSATTLDPIPGVPLVDDETWHETLRSTPDQILDLLQLFVNQTPACAYRPQSGTHAYRQHIVWGCAKCQAAAICRMAGRYVREYDGDDRSATASQSEILRTP
jgi:hypothetical protein